MNADQLLLDHLKTQALDPDTIFYGYHGIEADTTFIIGDLNFDGKPEVWDENGHWTHPDLASSRGIAYLRRSPEQPVVLGRTGLFARKMLLAFWDHNRADSTLSIPTPEYDNDYIKTKILPILLKSHLITSSTLWWGMDMRFQGTVGESLGADQTVQTDKQTYDVAGQPYTFSQLMAVLHTMPRGAQQRKVVEHFICSQDDPRFAEAKMKIRCDRKVTGPVLPNRLPKDFTMNTQRSLNRAYDRMRGARRKKLAKKLLHPVKKGGGATDGRAKSQIPTRT